MVVMIKIQKAETRNIAELMPLIAAYWEFEALAGFDPRRLAAPLERLLSDPKLGAGWMAWQDGVAVGYVLAVYVFSLEHHGLTAEIDELFVLPKWRQSGAGSELLRVAESECERMGCTNISLQLGRENAAARRFYHRLGFRERAGFELLDKDLRDHAHGPTSPPIFDL